MNILQSKIYQNEIAEMSEKIPALKVLSGKVVVISGATGMIGSYLIDLIMYLNCYKSFCCTIYALGRSMEKLQKRFDIYFSSVYFKPIECDVNNEIPDFSKHIDYIIHAASNTHPVAYATDPIGTLVTNVLGTKNLLDFAANSQCGRFVFLSSVEIYGESRGDVESFDEEYLGYLNCNTLRACYPEGKRSGEALCQAYIKQKQMDIVIPRISRVYGPTLLPSDTKALSQFIHKSVAGENIVLKSDGTQLYSYTYVADVISGILKIMADGYCGQAYNISVPDCNVTLKTLAQTLASIAKTNVVFEIPDQIEASGYSKATFAVLNSEKLCSLGWQPMFSLDESLCRTVSILKELR